MGPVVDLTREKRTGSFAHPAPPAYVDLLPPCNNACPAGENIQAWLAVIQAGKYRAAWEMLVRDNPLPAVHGRACYHPCEHACNRDALEAAVSIHAVERFLGDLAAERWIPPIEAPPSGKRVLVVGTGRAGSPPVSDRIVSMAHPRSFGRSPRSCRRHQDGAGWVDTPLDSKTGPEVALGARRVRET